MLRVLLSWLGEEYSRLDVDEACTQVAGPDRLELGEQVLCAAKGK